MTGDARTTLLDLVTHRRTASLGTLHRGEPAVSMVPYALLPDGSGLVIHVSRLASHTADLLASPRVSVMIAAAEEEGGDGGPQALPRIAIRGDAVELAGDEADEAREAYLARFPSAAPIFELGDFLLIAIRPESVRVIAGFGAAST
ncbi:MAG: pyridoxamine 5'-phosphate oxidase family protein, partial [Thermoanaerobaculia bacterium]